MGSVLRAKRSDRVLQLSWIPSPLCRPAWLTGRWLAASSSCCFTFYKQIYTFLSSLQHPAAPPSVARGKVSRHLIVIGVCRRRRKSRMGCSDV